MKIQLIILLPVIVLMLSCKNKAAKGHLAPKEMQKVLIDLTLAEGYATMVKDSLHKPGFKNYDSLGGYYKDVLAHYKITQEQFNESLDWYKAHPDELDSIYSNMQAVIAKWQKPQNQDPAKAN